VYTSLGLPEKAKMGFTACLPGQGQDISPPPSRTLAATMQIVSTAKGDRSCKDANVSTAESKTGRKVEQPWKNLQKVSERSYGKGNKNYIWNSSVASASDIMLLDTTCIFELATTHSITGWLAYHPEIGGREASASAS